MAFSLVGGLTMGLQLEKNSVTMMAKDTIIRELELNFFIIVLFGFPRI